MMMMNRFDSIPLRLLERRGGMWEIPCLVVVGKGSATERFLSARNRGREGSLAVEGAFLGSNQKGERVEKS